MSGLFSILSLIPSSSSRVRQVLGNRSRSRSTSTKISIVIVQIILLQYINYLTALNLLTIFFFRKEVTHTINTHTFFVFEISDRAAKVYI